MFIFGFSGLLLDILVRVLVVMIDLIGKLRLITGRVLFGIGFTLLSILVAHASNINDKILHWWLDWNTPEFFKRTAIWLPDYEAVIQGREIEGIDLNASGITFNPDTKTFWVVVNNPQLIFEMSADLVPIRKVVLENFIDTEAIAYAGNGKFVIADERDQTIAVATITTLTKSIDRQVLPRITLDKGGQENKGIEGVAVDQDSELIYVVKEKNPLEIVTVSGLTDGRAGIEVETIDVCNVKLDDLSGLHFDAKSGHLLILSDESKLLAEIDLLGRRVSYMELESGFGKLLNDIPQAEGVTLDSEGGLYIVSEPNLIYQFKKQQRVSEASR